MEVLKHIVVALTSPLVFALVLFVIGWGIAALDYRRVSRHLRVFAFVWLAIFSQSYTSNLLLHPLEHGTQITMSSEPTDYIHVLACYYITSGNITEVSRWSECSLQRNVEAFRLYKASDDKSKIIVTGGNFLEDEQTIYAEKAVEFFNSLGVPLADIIVLPTGTTTAEEVSAVLKFKKNGSLKVVSSATHMTRLSLLYAPIGHEVSYQPVDFHSKGSLTPFLELPSVYALKNAQHAFYEYFALAKFYLFK
ncbi:hypothetical protein D210916BOD24_08100 [Alteromonas sp. D210916BOD_24]|uniref:YdcF family protein n=1 Tax=Alteromonas sp. D210916BOD_24 TaxID=3157618 RepID=UPI00399C5C4F